MIEACLFKLYLPGSATQCGRVLLLKKSYPARQESAGLAGNKKIPTYRSLGWDFSSAKIVMFC